MIEVRGAAQALLLATPLPAPAAPLCAQPGDLRPVIASGHTELASRMASGQAAFDRERAAPTCLRTQRDEREARLQRIARHAELDGAGRVFAVWVRRELCALPRPERIAAEARQREWTRERIGDASVRVENLALALADLDGAVQRRLAAAPVAPRLGPSIEWLSSGVQWQTAASTLLDGSRRMPWQSGWLLLVAALVTLSAPGPGASGLARHHGLAGPRPNPA